MSKLKYIGFLTRVTAYNIQTRSFSQSKLDLKTAKEAPLKISQACVDRLNKIKSDGQFLRIIVDGGGCSGFQYRFDLDSKINEDDECVEKDGVKIVIDKISLPFLKGSTVDYQEELIRSAFRIIDNPQSDSGCSCGSSFSVKMT